VTHLVKLDYSLRKRVSTNLVNFESRQVDTGKRTHAAVAITLVDCRTSAGIGDIPFDPVNIDQAAFILTTRTAKLKHHSGQRVFPGGRIDKGESPEQAALRELEEEVGLKLDPGQVLGRLDDYVTRSGFVITPIIAWGGRETELNANPDEVDSIHRIPLSELMRKDAPILEPIPESEYPVLKMPLGNDWFAAPTAAIAYQFREVGILGKSTRVAHYEQPYFAWK
jgi:8-oxo-dGTP pyrophosphatase MutT (NUDIX family)